MNFGCLVFVYCLPLCLFHSSLRQAVAPQARVEVNTARCSVASVGVDHSEGGWPKEVDHTDPDQASRYRKNVERDEEFLSVTQGLVKGVEWAVKQNNTLNIYEDYFPEEDRATSWPECSVKTVAIYKDAREGEGRGVTSAAWAVGGDRIALAYCRQEYLVRHSEEDRTSFIFSVEDPSEPLQSLQPDQALSCVEWSSRDPAQLASGGVAGALHLWDTRQRGDLRPQASTLTPKGEGVASLAWLATKQGTELLVAREDGSVLRWDIRKPGEVVQECSISEGLEEGQVKPGITCMDYEPSTPQRFLVGSDQGSIYSLRYLTDCSQSILLLS